MKWSDTERAIRIRVGWYKFKLIAFEYLRVVWTAFWFFGTLSAVAAFWWMVWSRCPSG